MAIVNFYKGTQAQYDALTKDAYTFYLVEGEASKDLYLGAVKLSNAADLAGAITRISANESDIDTIEATLTTLNGADTEDGSIAKMIKDAVDAVKTQIGAMDNLQTTEKGTIVGAINEVLAAVGAGGTDAQVTIDTSTTTEGMAKSYTIKQGTSTVGTIDIPKDMVVSSATIVNEDAEGNQGTFIKMVIANSADVLYINVGTLVDIYTAAENATQVQLTINQSTNEISAAIVAESVTATELAENAVTTVKIADKNVTKAKLADDIRTSLGKADNSISGVKMGTATLTVIDGVAMTTMGEGSIQGTISIASQNVPVKGLKSAAYTESSAYDAAGSANAVKAAVIGAAEDTATDDTIKGAKKYTDEAVAAVKVEWKTIE